MLYFFSSIRVKITIYSARKFKHLISYKI